MSALFTIKFMKPVMIISFILLGFYPLSGQDNQHKEVQDVDIKMDELIKRANSLRSKSEKLKLMINSNENFVMDENMEGMHARDKVIELTNELSSLVNSLGDISSSLNDILSSDEVLDNEETSENFSAMFFNLNTLIDEADNFLINIEQYQEILRTHNNSKQNK